MFDVGFTELVLIAVLGLIVVGPERLPTAAKKPARGLAEPNEPLTTFSWTSNENWMPKSYANR